MTASGPSTGAPVVSGAGSSHSGHPAAPVASALQARIGHLPQMTFRQAGIRNPSLPTLLSLFFMLLAFFIVLNSLSQHDTRKQISVAASIDETFGATSAADTMSAAENIRQITTGILRGLASYFGSLLPADRQKLLISTDQLTIKVPFDLFFKTVNGQATSDLTDQAPTILRQISKTLEARPAGWGCEINLELASAAPGQVDVERAGRLAVMLSSSDTQRRNELSVGLGTGDGQWLTMVIRLRPPELPSLSAQRTTAGTPGQGPVSAGAASRVAP